MSKESKLMTQRRFSRLKHSGVLAKQKAIIKSYLDDKGVTRIKSTDKETYALGVLLSLLGEKSYGVDIRGLLDGESLNECELLWEVVGIGLDEWTRLVKFQKEQENKPLRDADLILKQWIGSIAAVITEGPLELSKERRNTFEGISETVMSLYVYYHYNERVSVGRISESLGLSEARVRELIKTADKMLGEMK